MATVKFWLILYDGIMQIGNNEFIIFAERVSPGRTRKNRSVIKSGKKQPKVCLVGPE